MFVLSVMPSAYSSVTPAGSGGGGGGGGAASNITPTNNSAISRFFMKNTSQFFERNYCQSIAMGKKKTPSPCRFHHPVHPVHHSTYRQLHAFFLFLPTVIFLATPFLLCKQAYSARSPATPTFGVRHLCDPRRLCLAASSHRRIKNFPNSFFIFPPFSSWFWEKTEGRTPTGMGQHDQR